ncbi:MAG: glycoside hydrolase family 13 protein, partial [Eggerthellaceae bacterium]|nr:glycoside hydrolase family 13 protein [Eggerthellaceae bacterium]
DWFCYYGPREGRVGGKGKVYDYSPSSYQLTVYKETKMPEWYRKGIVYQIFPDSFFRGSGEFDYSKLPDKIHKNGPKREFREWGESPRYKRLEDGGIDTWGFYGGTLKGIEEKLDYIKELGASIIYLNPIFMAASSHRYDTADYTKIEPLLGTEEDFKSLCKQAKKRGIRIILDGVFNHTGCDSVYFNKYKNFGDGGAYNKEHSKYHDWYTFNEDGTYSAWWGNQDLPDLNEHNESYRNYICGEDGVVQKWLKLGASGWRLDVADELPDDFIADIRRAGKKVKRDALLMGEIWEDASNKRAYGKLRKYFNGDEFDCVMNYPFCTAIEDFLVGNIDAEFVAETITSLQENYPRQAFFGNLNMLSSHDRMRMMTVLGEAPNPDDMSEEEQANYQLSDEQYGLAVARSWLAVLAQATFPGVPSIYYGDEVGMQGFRDPFNRASHPWEKGDINVYNMFCNALSMRKIFSHHYTDGDFSIKSHGHDVLMWSWSYKGEHIDIIINRSRYDYCSLELEKKSQCVDDLINGRCNELDNGNIEINLTPLGSAFIVHHKRSEMAVHFERGSGVLCHITSLPDSSAPKPKKFVREKPMTEEEIQQLEKPSFDEVKDDLGTFADGKEFV